MRPIMNIFSPVSGWNADSYIFLALHTCSSVVPTGSFLCLLVKKQNNHTATVEYTSSKFNSSPQTLTSLLLPGVVTRTFEKHSVPCLQTECNINRIMHLTGGVD